MCILYQNLSTSQNMTCRKKCYSEIIYLAQENKNNFHDIQNNLDSISNALNINHKIGIGLTEWNVRLCGEGGCNSSYNGILGGLYTANFYTQFYDAYIKNEVDLRLNNHFALIATGNNLIHILLDNEVHDSTGAQSTVSKNVNFAMIAKASGYGAAICGNKLEVIDELFSQKENDGPIFGHLKICSGTIENLPRPNISPDQILRRMMQHINASF